MLAQLALMGRGTQALVSFASLASSVFCSARRNAVLRRARAAHRRAAPLPRQKMGASPPSVPMTTFPKPWGRCYRETVADTRIISDRSHPTVTLACRV